MAPKLISRLRERRQRAGLSQQALADRSGVSRQAILAIEAGRQVPSTTLSLQLARALRCTVDELFVLAGPGQLVATLAPHGEATDRVALGRVDGRWVAHPLSPGAPEAADALVRGGGPEALAVQTLRDPASLERNVLVAGCAPLLGVLAARLGARHADARATWVPANSHTALELLEAGLVHVAGLHLEDHAPLVQAHFPGQRMLVVNLTRWQQGLVLAPGNPMGIHEVKDVLREDVRFVRREEGAGARALMQSVLRAQGHSLEELGAGPSADGHAAVASLVRWGAADAGVAIESAASAQGLGFVPMAEERFDLVVPASRAAHPAVSRLLDLLTQADFRIEAEVIPGYDLSLVGQTTTVEAA